MNARAEILAAVRANRPVVSAAPISPFRATATDEPLVERFAAALVRMGGEIIETQGDTGASLAQLVGSDGGSCSTVAEFRGDIDPYQLDIDEPSLAALLASVKVAIVRATLAVAETGSVLLTERDLVVNALGYLAQHLVVLLDPGEIVATLHEAYPHPAFRHCAYACLHSGPSATADIEGVLIRGAQGVRSLRVMLVPRPAGATHRFLNPEREL